jgi:osmotically-inducible protein OsmY
MRGRRSPKTPGEKVIEDALVSALDIDYLKVYVIRGVPYVEGSVCGLRDKRRATEIVSSLCGATRIVNRLRVAPQVKRNDETIVKAARDRLRALSEPCLAEVDLRCRNGIVELRAEVECWAMRRTAETAVRSVRGVVSVINHLQVKGADRPARELESEMRRALHECLSLDVAAIEVRFKGGNVQLMGTVPSPYHRLAAEELVRWFSPVRDVVNGLATKDPLLLSEDADTIQEEQSTAPSA